MRGTLQRSAMLSGVARGVAGLAGLAVLSVLIAACGSKHHPPLANDAPPISGGTGDLIGSDAGSMPAACNTLVDGGSCGCQDVPLFADPPTMYFVLDRSGSMAESNKWTTVRLAVADVLRAIGPRANFGAAVFPGPSNVDQCASGIEVMSVRRGDPPSTSGLDGPVTTELLSSTAAAASGGTPTSATLTALMPKLAQLKGNLFVVLATDGGPNCNQAATCTIAGCMPNIEGVAGCDATTNCCAPPKGTPSNCLDDQATLAAVNKLKAAGIPTYVIGIPGSAPYAALLDSLAIAGGTAQTTGTSKYYRVDSTDQTALLTALKSVAAKVTATCTFKLQGNVDPTLVNLFFDEVVVPQDTTNGWTMTGGTITLQGTSCQKVLNGDVLDVRIIAGCPTVLK